MGVLINSGESFYNIYVYQIIMYILNSLEFINYTSVKLEKSKSKHLKMVKGNEKFGHLNLHP